LIPPSPPRRRWRQAEAYPTVRAVRHTLSPALRADFFNEISDFAP
jgi:hypothetical protein